MPFSERTDWRDTPSVPPPPGSTPVHAEDILRWERGIAEAHEQLGGTLTKADADATYVRTVNGSPVGPDGNVTIDAGTATPQYVEGLPMARMADGSLRRVTSRSDVLGTNGDSITAGVGDELNRGGWAGRVAERVGMTLFNLGAAGRASSDIAMRSGGLIPLITVAGNTIPAATTPVAVTQILPKTSWRWTPGTNSNHIFEGKLAGVPGTLTHDTSASAPDKGWTFTRTTAGEAVTITPESPFVMTLADNRLDATWIFASGRNNGYDQNSYLDAVRDMTAEIMHLSPIAPRFLVLSILTAPGEKNTGTSYGYIKAANDALAAKYGDRYVDVRRHLIDHGLQEAGITPTAADLDCIAKDTIPPSLIDGGAGVHPNAAGYTVMANYIIGVLVAKGWAVDQGAPPVQADVYFEEQFTTDDPATWGNTTVGNLSWTKSNSSAVASKSGGLGYFASPTTAVAFHTVNAGRSDGVFRAKLGAIAGVPNPYVLFRFVDSSNFLALSRVASADQRWLVRNRLAGTNNTLATLTTPIAAGDEFEVRLNGSSVVILINGTQVYSGTVTDHQAGTQFGIGNDNNAGLGWDNLSLKSV